MSKPDVNPLFPVADCHRIRGNALPLFQEMIRKLDKESNGMPKHVSAEKMPNSLAAAHPGKLLEWIERIGLKQQREP